MNSYQLSRFLQSLSTVNIPYKTHSGDEISLRCPMCGSSHSNNRLTLNINTATDKWICPRCPGSMKGRDAVKLLKVLRLDHLLPIFEKDSDEVLTDDDSLIKLRKKLLFGEDLVIKPASIVSMPEGYRTDWEDTMTGRMLYKYLLNNRKLPARVIKQYELGYVVKGRYAGSVVLPVRMDRKLRFWQIRRVLFMNSSLPKYDSPKVDKIDVLFGYDSIQSNAIYVVEGIFDALRLGPENCVGLLGKTISDEQIALLSSKNVESVTVMLDGEAWKNTKEVASRIAQKLWSVKTVTAARLQCGFDPGDLGKIALRKISETIVLK